MAENKILDTIVKKVDGLADDVRSNTYRLDKVETKLDKVETRLENVESNLNTLGSKVDTLTDVVRDLSTNVRTLSGQFSAVTSKVIEHDQRLNGLDDRVTVLEAETH